MIVQIQVGKVKRVACYARAETFTEAVASVALASYPGSLFFESLVHTDYACVHFPQHSWEIVIFHYSLMRGRIKGPRPPVNPMQSDKTFITWVIKILHGNGAPKATNLRLATRMSLPAATIIMQCTDCSSI